MKLKLKELKTDVLYEKKIDRFTKRQKSIIIIAGVLVFVFAITFFGASFGIISFDAASARIMSLFDSSSKNFPLDVDSDKTVNIERFGKGIILLTDKEVRVISASGSTVYTEVHTYSRPALSVNGGSAIVFDRGSTGYMLLNEKKKIGSGEAPGVIISAQTGKNGSYALATYGEKSTSVLSVFNKNDTLIFQWNCAYEFITSIALSDDGKYAGVALMNSKDGDIYTAVHLFGFDYKEPIKSVTVENTVPLDIIFSKPGVLTLFGDTGVYNINKKQDEPECVIGYYSPEFNSKCINSDGSYCVALAKYGSTNVFEINIFNKNGKLKRTVDVNESILQVKTGDKYLFALAENKILVYNYKGKLISEIQTQGDLYGIYPNDKYIFIYSLDHITRAYSYGDQTVITGE